MADTTDIARQRTIATTQLFEKFIRERNLEWDDETWSDTDRRDFNKLAATHNAKWAKRVADVDAQ